MRSLDIADLFITRHGDETRITNLSINKLVYFTQVAAIKRYGTPIFGDNIEAWRYGPVEPLVYHAFSHYGPSAITEPAEELPNERDDSEATLLVDSVFENYGRLTAFDLVDITHRPGSAWSKAYARGYNEIITLEDIRGSDEYSRDVDYGSTLAAGYRDAEQKWPNTLRLLENS
jgi:uncharacterized phage-associated protein